MLKRKLLSCFFPLFLGLAVTPANAAETVDVDAVKGKLIFADDFNSQAAMSKWVVETFPVSVIKVENEELDIYSPKGTTIWFGEKLPKNVVIEFDAEVKKSDDPIERGADMNFFVAAKDPATNDFFANSKKRGGAGKNYKPLAMYYAGLGVHKNTGARMRRFDGEGNKPLLPEHDLKGPKYQNTPNEVVKVQIINDMNGIKVWRAGVEIFNFNDKKAYNGGYFGFRTWKSHLEIDNFKVYKLKK